MLQEIIFNRAKPEDDYFLFALYVERRSGEIAGLGWSDADVNAFLRMQFDMRRKSYEMRYPGAEYRIIQSEGLPLGEMIVHRTGKTLALVDITVSAEFRGRGVGARAIRILLQEANDANLPVILHVDRANPDAQRLYQRLGFVVTNDSDQLWVEMKWPGNKLQN